MIDFVLRKNSERLRNCMTVTVKDIAKEAGVSIAAVSKALNNRGGISLALKRRIEQIAHRRGYAPYMKARQTGVYASSTQYIAILYAYAGEHLVMPIQHGIDEVLRDTRYLELRFTLSVHDQVYNQDRMQIFIDKILQDKSIAGVLSVFLGITESSIASLQKNGTPVVLLSNYSDCGKCVVIDNVEAGFQATSELLALGRRKIGLIMPEENSEHIWQDRLTGYKKALAKAKIAYDPYLLFYDHTYSLNEVALATKTLLERDPSIDAIIYGSDVQAYGGMKALKEVGKKIPDDIAILGFDDMTFSQITEPPLTSIHQPMFEMGKTGATLLLESIRKKDFSHKTVMLHPHLVRRASTHKDMGEEKLL